MHVPLIAFESGLGLLVIGWGFWELASLRRDRRRTQALAGGANASSESSDAAESGQTVETGAAQAPEAGRSR